MFVNKTITIYWTHETNAIRGFVDKDKEVGNGGRHDNNQSTLTLKNMFYPGTYGNTNAVLSSDSQRVNSRLVAVIEHYESHPKAGEELKDSAHKEDDIDSLAEHLTHIPDVMDPNIYIVHVHVGLFHDVPKSVTDSHTHKDGKAIDTIFLLQERLWRCPQLTLLVFLPSGSRQWVAIESTSMKNVQDLCFNMFTIHHPLEISLIPVEQWIMYLQWGPTCPPVKPTSWARLKRLSILKESNVDKNVWKYAGDLAFVLDLPSTSTAHLCLVPQLTVSIEGDRKKTINAKANGCLDCCIPRRSDNDQRTGISPIIWTWPCDGIVGRASS